MWIKSLPKGKQTKTEMEFSFTVTKTFMTEQKKERLLKYKDQ